MHKTLGERAETGSLAGASRGRMSCWSTSAWVKSPDSRTARQLAGNGQPAALIMISTHAGADYADLIAESPAVGFLPEAELSAAAIRQVLGTD